MEAIYVTITGSSTSP